MNRRNFLHDVLMAAPALAWAQQLPVANRNLLDSRTEIAKAPLRPEDDARLKYIARMPEWGALDGVAVSLNGRRIDPQREESYLGVSGLSPRDEVMFTFPVPERRVNRVIGRLPYKLTLRGANVVAIDPAGKAYPFFKEQPQGQLVEKERFVPSRKVMS